MSRRRTTTTATGELSVVWRDGVHLAGTSIWCDVRRRRDICFASSADRVDRVSARMIATPDTLALLGADPRDGHLAVPLRQPFTLGTLRLELIPSGHGLGAAALYVEQAGRRVLYAADVRASGVQGLADPAEARPCDAVVVRVDHPYEFATFPPAAAAAEQLVAWLRAHLAAGQRPGVRCSSMLHAFEVATVLVRAGLPLAGAEPLRRFAAHGGPAIGRPGRAGAVILQYHPARRPAGPTALLFHVASQSHAGFDAGFDWATVSARDELLAWIASTGAREVYITGAGAETYVDALPHAQLLRPPLQQLLFAGRS